MIVNYESGAYANPQYYYGLSIMPCWITVITELVEYHAYRVVTFTSSYRNVKAVTA